MEPEKISPLIVELMKFRGEEMQRAMRDLEIHRQLWEDVLGATSNDPLDAQIVLDDVLDAEFIDA